MPPNLQTVSLKFARRRSAKVMGTLAMKGTDPPEGEEVQGVLVTHNFTTKLVAPKDLATYTPLRTGSISSKLHVPFAGSIGTLRLFVKEMFARVLETQIEMNGKSCTKFSLYQEKVCRSNVQSVADVWDASDIDDFTMQVTVLLGKNDAVAVVEWEASPAGDVIADALIALIMHAQSSPASIRLTSKPCRHPRAEKDDEEDTPETKKSTKNEETLTMNRLRLIKHTLLDQFRNVEVVYEGNAATYEITTDTGLDTVVVPGEEPLVCTAKVAFADSNGGTAEISVECVDKKLASNVQECLRNLARSLAPLET
jgi:hypothetical protein